jgi:DNA-binding LacI/PurR family transcriptional regulator
LKDKKAGAFAGVIATSELFNFSEEIFYNLDVPCVAISAIREIASISNLNIDKESFHYQLSERIADLGCKRIAFIVAEDYTENREDGIRHYFKKNGLNYDDDYIQCFSVKEPFWVERYVSLMMRMPKELRPDCFMAIDDNFLPYVFEQLTKSGKMPGKDIHVVSHANFPIEYDKYPGVNFVGYDVVNILRQGILTLQDGKSTDKEVIIKSVTR